MILKVQSVLKKHKLDVRMVFSITLSNMIKENEIKINSWYMSNKRPRGKYLNFVVFQITVIHASQLFEIRVMLHTLSLIDVTFKIKIRL